MVFNENFSCYQQYFKFVIQSFNSKLFIIETMEILDLPDLGFLEVFSFFSHQEKVNKLLPVCKRWYWLLQNDFQQLVVYARRLPHRLCWDPFSEKAIDDRFIIRAKNLNGEFAFKFRNLRKLFLFKVGHLHSFLNPQNEDTFSRLVELRINYLEQLEGQVVNILFKQKLILISNYHW